MIAITAIERIVPQTEGRFRNSFIYRCLSPMSCSGIFIWKTETLIEALRTYSPDIASRFDAGIEAFGTPDELTFIARELFTDVCRL